MKIFLLFFVFYFSSICFQESNAEIVCNNYVSDIDIINRNPFYVRTFWYDYITSVGLDSRQRVSQFTIANNVNPATNIYCLKNLLKLVLINTNLSIVPDIKNFQNLNSLIIQSDNGCIGQHLPAEFGQLTSLTNLELTDIKNLEDLPNEIEALIQLQSLTLKKIPNLNKIPDDSIGKLTNLNELNLIDLPNLSNVPSTMNNFQSLQRLVISNLNINSLRLDNLARLMTISIGSNSLLQTIQLTNMLQFSSIDIQKNTELLTLKLQNVSMTNSLTVYANTKLTSIVMDNVSGLQVISITNSEQLKKISIENADRLYSLSLNSLANFESISIHNAPLLSTVSIQYSPLLQTILFNNTSSMQTLDLSGCQLTTFPESILTIKSLVTLVLTTNRLSALPLTLSTDLPNLLFLNLVNNKFQGAIFQPPLIYLRELYLSNNSFTSLDGIGSYQSLQRFELDFNQISSIPTEIMQLSPMLQSLQARFNQLTTIPYSMTNMRSLTSFFADKNNISSSERLYLINAFQQSLVKLYI
ncbi:unnamed protein product [Rotaria socialis]|uniref:Uncharacterized protein n=2 Tax=Rotaria socialis TaxID=392032 RepID=A0A817SE85_9BILA|nr:unnamed protein product [Rotaria socialis]CAF3287224.1 unnamed protein product [Rotaria socialis]CAF3397212.1 unnamed protein product [Rotaria socialis]CAF4338474.1 unnamed protein product [Rotaria socialis]CAF4751508.1 unnamed protein product [Rotaria socialis]